MANKLVINTQYCENYAAHNDNYKHGVDTPYWKNKGGSTYVVYGITPEQALKISHNGIPTLSDLIEFSNEYAEESIISYNFEAEDYQVVADWEHEIVLSYDKSVGVWRANVEREPYCPQKEFDMISESWIMDEGNTRVEGSYKMLYRTMDGHWVTEDTITNMRKAVEETV